MRHPARCLALAPALALLLLAMPPRPAIAGTDAPAVLAEMARLDLRVASVGYRLLTAGPPLCRELAPQAGLVVHDVRQYAVALRPAAMRLFGFAGWPIVLAVVPGSPADRAGIQPNDGIVEVDGVAVATTPTPAPDRRPPSDDAEAAVEAQLARAYANGRTTLVLERGGTRRTVSVDPVAGCASTVQLEPGTARDAWSDGTGVAVTSGLVAETRDDDELAAVIGHELAHNILHHAERLHAAGIGRGLFSRVGDKAAQVRATEREADDVGLYLAARAGYDPAAAASFWQRFGAAHGDGLFTDATHPGWRERVAALSHSATEIAARRARGEPLVPGSPGR